MRNDCRIVEDLLPVYLEGLCQDETAEFVSEHLSGCEECNKKFRVMENPAPVEALDKSEIQAAKKPFKRIVLKTAFKTAACICAVALIAVFVGNIIALNNCRIIGPVDRELYFYEAEFVSTEGGKTVAKKKYTNENGKMLEAIGRRMILTYANSFEYKNYIIDVESADGCSAAVWGDRYYELFRTQNELDSVCGGSVYIAVREKDTGNRIYFEELGAHDRNVIETALKPMAYIDEVITRHVIENYRDSYTECLEICGEVKGMYKAGMYLDENSDGKTEVVKLSVVAAKDSKDNALYTFKDTITFDLTGWKQGRLPTYKIESKKIGGGDSFDLEEAYKKYHMYEENLPLY